MDLNQHLTKVVESIILEITANVSSQIDTYVTDAINTKLSSFDFSNYIQKAATEAFEKKVSEYTIDPKKLENRIVEKINTTIDEAQASTGALITDALNQKIANMNFQRTLTDAMSTIIADKIHEFTFPEKSIYANAINFDNSTISGNNIRGGIITEFSSTGIDDRATNVALTILDTDTVIENNLLTKHLTVDGDMTINGKFIVNGNIPTSSKFYKELISSTSSSTLQKLDATLFANFSNTIFDRIRTDGIDLKKITIDDKEIINGNSLGSQIINSNLQNLGLLKELQVSGESFLAQTLYVTAKRVGINTVEPGSALSIWDDEVELVAQKRQKDVGQFGTLRQQKLILSSNNKDNITLEPDGSIRVSEIKMGNLKFTVSESPPNFVSERGHIVWNANPNVGGPLGWVCLGASNWANFGIID